MIAKVGTSHIHLYTIEIIPIYGYILPLMLPCSTGTVMCCYNSLLFIGKQPLGSRSC